MGLDAFALARPQVAGLPAFVPGVPSPPLPTAGSARIARLASNENALGPSPRVVEAVARAVTEAHRYPDPSGAPLKRALAEFLGVTPAHIALGAGANELIELLVHAFVGPDDEVVVSRPTFVMYGVAVRLLGGRLVEVPARGWEHDLEAMRAAIGPRTRIVFVCNPDNPTGTIVRRAAFERFLAGVPPGVVVVSDEAYHEYVEDPEYPRTLDLLEQDVTLVVLRTFSKVHALAGLRVGYAVARPPLAAVIERVRQPYTVNALAQAAALAALGDREHVERSRALARVERPWLARELAALGVRTVPSHANFLLADLACDSHVLCTALAERGLDLREGLALGLPAPCVRITLGTRAENEALVHALASLRGPGAVPAG